MSQEPVSPSAVFSHFQMGNRGSAWGRGLVGATHQWQLERDFLPNPCDLSWACLVPPPSPRCLPHAHPTLCSLPVRRGTQGALAAVSRL